VNYTQMVVLSFGSSLSNTPTSTITGYTYPSMQWTHQVTIKRYLGNWIAFIANRNSNITRFDFGSSLTNVPVVTNIPNVGSVANPTNFSLYEQGGNWYMLVTSLISGGLSRYDFGTNLLNNAPTGTMIAGPGGLINLPRYISLLNDCQGHLIGYMGNETGNILKLDFAGSITNVPVVTVAGYAGTSTINVCAPVSYNDTLAFMFVDYSGSLVMYHPMYFAPVSFINYYNPVQPYTYTTPGTYNVSLMLDQGYPTGPFVFCKSIVVIPASGTTSSRDTTVCLSAPLTLYADAVGQYIWSNTDTTSSIHVTGSGTYWVTTTTGSCHYVSDTTHVSYSTSLAVDLGNDTAFCVGNSIILSPVEPTGTTLFWSNGTSGPSITIDSSGTYWVRAIDGGCTGADTMHVVVNPDPKVDLGPDQTVCAGTQVTLQSSDSYVSPTYTWNTGSNAASIDPGGASGTYWLSVMVAGCTGSDTVVVTYTPLPLVNLGDDVTICPGNSLTLGVPEPAGAHYSWSTGSTDSSIKVTDSGSYTLTVTVDGCSASSTVTVTSGTITPVFLGPDTSLCLGETVVFSVNAPDARWSNGTHGPSLKIDFPGTYWVIVPESCGDVSDTVKVDYHICDIGFPSAFTPNGDGLNDKIGVEGTLKYYQDFSLGIYNRWGERVYYSEDIFGGWDGIYKGTKQDMGTYFYMIYYSIEGKKHMLKGDFQLVR